MRTDTNSSLQTARYCLRKYELRYQQRLVRDRDEESEALAVGTVWHAAHDALARGTDPFHVILRTAPSDLWRVKLARLFAAYEWRWRTEDCTFDRVDAELELGSASGGLRGKLDALWRLSDGRRVLVERKTTSSSLDDDSPYWNRLRLDTQVGIYALLVEDAPDLILYDVVRKPTIAPKKIAKADYARMVDECDAGGQFRYFETFPESSLPTEPHETPELYGARLTSDIGDRPDFYFARRLVARTMNDYRALISDVREQLAIIDFCEERGTWPKNPDACDAFGLCEFFSLCSRNEHPKNGEVPDGYRRREHRHPELDARLGAS